MGFCKSNQKSIPVVGFLTRNDCDVLRAKTGGYRRFTHRTIIPPTTLLDSRATGMFINWSFVQKHQLETTPLPQPILICNVNGSPNENGSVTEEVHVTLCFGRHSARAQLAVANLGQQMVIIVHSWLTLHNPEVNWLSHKVSLTRC